MDADVITTLPLTLADRNRLGRGLKSSIFFLTTEHCTPRPPEDAIELAACRKLLGKLRELKNIGADGKGQAAIAASIREAAADTNSNDNEIEILGAALEEAMSRLTIQAAREVKKAMRGFRCQET